MHHIHEFTFKLSVLLVSDITLPVIIARDAIRCLSATDYAQLLTPVCCTAWQDNFFRINMEKPENITCTVCVRPGGDVHHSLIDHMSVDHLATKAQRPMCLPT